MMFHFLLDIDTNFLFAWLSKNGRAQCYNVGKCKCWLFEAISMYLIWKFAEICSCKADLCVR